MSWVTWPLIAGLSALLGRAGCARTIDVFRRAGEHMCLGIPGEIVELNADLPELAKVDVSGVRRAINIGLLEPGTLTPGDWVLIHVGFALCKIDEAEAKATLDFLTGLGRRARTHRRRRGPCHGHRRGRRNHRPRRLAEALATAPPDAAPTATFRSDTRRRRRAAAAIPGSRVLILYFLAGPLDATMYLPALTQ